MTATPTLTLAQFLEARLAEDEAAARAAAAGRSGHWASWNRSWDTGRNRDLVDDESGERMVCLPMDLDDHIAHHDPARVLREVEAKRAILAAHKSQVEGDDEAAWIVASNVLLRALASVYRDHPAYDGRWAE